MGQAIAGDADSYRYLAESIRKFPPMPAFEAMIRKAASPTPRWSRSWAGWWRSIRGGRSDPVTSSLVHLSRLLYSEHLLPRMGQAIAGDADSYRYLAESIRKFPPLHGCERHAHGPGPEQRRSRLPGVLQPLQHGW
ncbi:class I SAM-dependent methyltransferase [Mycobacterium tuberculosis]|uniref:class I SAM-dependent methyltransferase n=1 Tax=Mycobacterium tuberculosis TaxID=1773 RepID=UPI00350F389C